MKKMRDATEAVTYLRSPRAIRERCLNIFEAGVAGKLAHFAVDLGKLADVADAVTAVTTEQYPTLAIPYHSRWNHFRVGGHDRVAELAPALAKVDAKERARSMFDLAVTSVLLDAGAGEAWKYREGETGETYARSEGLAVASFRMFAAGAFSSDGAQPFRADAAALKGLTAAALARGFQVTADNPLVGLEGRAALLRSLGDVLGGDAELFGAESPRVGNLVDHLVYHAKDNVLPAKEILRHIVRDLAGIWPGRVVVDGANLGDTWRHPHAGGAAASEGLVPFHKLSQWLTYSLIEPLEEMGIRVVDLDDLTGLPEYRNGGLFVDLGALVPKHGAVTNEAHAPGSEVIVEWRALTVSLLDRVAPMVRERLGKTAEEMPLAKILEGGTWTAGRRAASARRPDGSPPIRIASDGTVF